jgi:hypothetical protein
MVQFSIYAACFQQLLMRTGLDNAAIFDDKDHIGAPDGGEAMRDHDRGLAFH